MRALSTLLILAISLTLFAPVASLVGAEDPAKGFSGITTIGGGGTTLASPGRTYRLEWQDPVTGLTNYAPIKPVLGWPAGHPLTQNRMCGEGPFAAGEAIPSEGLWSKKGSEENSGFKPKCKRATSGQLFYAYGFPTGSSSNAHEGNKNAINIYLLIDDADEAFFVAVVDQPDNYQPDLPRPRMASLEVQITGDMKGLVPELVLGDDKKEVMWDSSTLSGGAEWTWSPCCTDGMALGPMPAEGFTIDFTLIRHYAQLDAIEAGSWVDSSSSISYRTVPLISPEQYKVPMVKGRSLNKGSNYPVGQQWLEKGEFDVPIEQSFRLTAYSTTEYCALLDSCGPCAADADCAWKPGGGCGAKQDTPDFNVGTLKAGDSLRKTTFLAQKSNNVKTGNVDVPADPTLAIDDIGQCPCDDPVGCWCPDGSPRGGRCSCDPTVTCAYCGHFSGGLTVEDVGKAVCVRDTNAHAMSRGTDGKINRGSESVIECRPAKVPAGVKPDDFHNIIKWSTAFHKPACAVDQYLAIAGRDKPILRPCGCEKFDPETGITTTEDIERARGRTMCHRPNLAFKKGGRGLSVEDETHREVGVCYQPHPEYPRLGVEDGGQLTYDGCRSDMVACVHMPRPPAAPAP